VNYRAEIFMYNHKFSKGKLLILNDLHNFIIFIPDNNEIKSELILRLSKFCKLGKSVTSQTLFLLNSHEIYLVGHDYKLLSGFIPYIY
jgi:hypothetical protein